MYRTAAIGVPKNNAQNAEQIAEDRHGGHHPHARQTNGRAHDLRVNEVALKLLKTDEEDDEPYSIHGVYDQQQKRADAATDVRAENRYQRSDRHNARDEQRVVKPDKRHADEAQAA